MADPDLRVAYLRALALSQHFKAAAQVLAVAAGQGVTPAKMAPAWMREEARRAAEAEHIDPKDLRADLDDALADVDRGWRAVAGNRKTSTLIEIGVLTAVDQAAVLVQQERWTIAAAVKDALAAYERAAWPEYAGRIDAVAFEEVVRARLEGEWLPHAVALLHRSGFIPSADATEVLRIAKAWERWVKQ